MLIILHILDYFPIFDSITTETRRKEAHYVYDPGR